MINSELTKNLARGQTGENDEIKISDNTSGSRSSSPANSSNGKLKRELKSRQDTLNQIAEDDNCPFKSEPL